MQTTDIPTPIDTAGQTCEGLPAKICSALDEQRNALSEARKRIIARYEQIEKWLENDDLPEDIRTNWEGMSEGLRQARRIIGGMWDDLPVPMPSAIPDHETVIQAFIAAVNATPPTPDEEAALRRIDEMTSEKLGFPVGHLREKQNAEVQQ